MSAAPQHGLHPFSNLDAWWFRPRVAGLIQYHRKVQQLKGITTFSAVSKWYFYQQIYMKYNFSISLFPWLVILSLFRCCVRPRPGRNEGWPRCNWYHSTIQLVYFLTHPPHLFLAASSMSNNPLKGLPDFRHYLATGHWPWSPPIEENIYFYSKKYLQLIDNCSWRYCIVENSFK